MKNITLALILIFAGTFIAIAQDFDATVSKNPVTVGERFQVTFTLNIEGSNFKAPDFKGFTVMSGPSQSQNIQIINGAMKRSLAFSYVLAADKTGEFTIGSATITSDGNTLKSNTVLVKVLPETDVQKQRRQQELDQEKALGDQAMQILKDNIFVKLSVSKRDVYQGEQITATYKLFIHPELNIVQINPSKIPSFNGFWTQELNIDKVNWQREIVNGVPFNAAVIKQVVLFPQRSGQLSIEPYEFDIIARLKVQSRRRNDPFSSFFDDPFFGGSYRDFPYKPKSESSSINVKSLPGNQPDNFAGAVGNLGMDAWLDKSSVKAGEPLTLKVKISGRGNMKLIEPLKVNFPPDFEVYDPKTIDNISVSAGGVTGNITYEYLFIPRNAGTYKIEPVIFSYFDLTNNSYNSVRSAEFEISVDKSEKTISGNVVSGVRKEEVQLIGKDIRFIKLTSGNLQKNRISFMFSDLFWLMLLLPLLIFFIIFFWLRKRKKLQSDILLFKNKRATKISRKRLSTAKKYMAKSEQNKFYEEINKAMWGYLGDKLAINTSELTKDNARRILNESGVSESMIDEFLNALDSAEFARYAPSASNHDMNSIYKSAVKSITDLEGVLR
ncbi:MAG: protein BatD [Candidatus Kapabacteria bacterium]|nr:protein BatD [Ignavibacteriota bacterium]MCW5884436.1 protein BatD [Candidatus Kapabacteria bacterium]